MHSSSVRPRRNTYHDSLLRNDGQSVTHKQPFRISFTAAKLDCFASWLSTGPVQEGGDSFRRSLLVLTLCISKLVLEKHDLVVL